MMQRWNEDAIRFMKDASEYGTYYRELTAELLPYLPKDGHICDAGCGLGYLASELSKHCKCVTALDSSISAITAMRKRQSIDHINIVCADIFTISDRFDAMVFCYFGRIEEILHLAKKLCRGTVLIIKRDCAEHTFSLGNVEHKKHTMEDTLGTLSALQIPFLKKSIALEMGQPFRSFNDALDFFRLYNKSSTPVSETAVAERLLQTGEPEFPLYLPSQRKMELIVFSARDIPEGSNGV